MGVIILGCYHTDHCVSDELRQWGLDHIPLPAGGGIFAETLEIRPADADLTNNLYGPSAGDAPVAGTIMVRDPKDEWRGATPFIDLPPRPTRLLTLIGLSTPEGVMLFTCYGGPAAMQVPSDPNIKDDPAKIAECEKFWAVHALSLAAKK